MKNIKLVVPDLKKYYYEKKLNEDPETMSYNAGYDVSYDGYNYDDGTILFPRDKWKKTYLKRQNSDRYFAYIKDTVINRYVGYVNYQYNCDDDRYECGVLIEAKYRGKGYSRDALRLLIMTAKLNGIDYLYDNFEADRGNTLELFKSIGFEVMEQQKWKKFHKDVDGVIVRIKTDIVERDLLRIKNKEDILDFMKKYIRYGWRDVNGKFHINTMKEFRRIYRTGSIQDTLKYGIGTCIEQVALMKYLADKINLKAKMFCTRVYEKEDFNDMDAEERMHCFILVYDSNKVYHIEHPNRYRIGIYEYDNELEALEKINKYFVELSGGISRPVTEFYEVKEKLSFKEFNAYINSLKESL